MHEFWQRRKSERHVARVVFREISDPCPVEPTATADKEVALAGQSATSAPSFSLGPSLANTQSPTSEYLMDADDIVQNQLLFDEWHHSAVTEEARLVPAKTGETTQLDTILPILSH